jgi:hypothetical protein
VLVLATHGSPRGVEVGGRTIGAAALADSLRYAGDLRLIHFSACLTMKANLADELAKGMPGRAVPISGYTTVVDWAASAVIEFMYFDLVLCRGMRPKEAADQLRKLMPFAGDKDVPGTPFKSAGFRILLPPGT